MNNLILSNGQTAHVKLSGIDAILECNPSGPAKASVRTSDGVTIEVEAGEDGHTIVELKVKKGDKEWRDILTIETVPTDPDKLEYSVATDELKPVAPPAAE